MAKGLALHVIFAYPKMSAEKMGHSEPKIQHVFSQEDGITTFVSPNTGKPVKIDGDGDEAGKYANIDEVLDIDPAEDRRLLRKIDLYLLPLICTTYCVQYIDKQTISVGAILGLRHDLKMTGERYSWAGSAFYFGYLFYEFIGSYTLQRFDLSTVLSAYITLWGILLCLHSVPQYAGFVVLRVLLGALESSITPAYVIITSQWYRKEEVFFRTALWFASNGIGIILGSGAIAYNVYRDADTYSIEAWKVIFLVTGAMTIVLGIVTYFHIPSKPTDAWFLTEREKQMVVERVCSNQQGFGNKHFKKEQFVETLLDRRTWLLFSMGIACNIPNGGLTNFSAILFTEKLGFSVGKTLLMGMPAGAVEIGGLALICYCYKSSLRKKHTVAVCWLYNDIPLGDRHNLHLGVGSIQLCGSHKEDHHQCHFFDRLLCRKFDWTPDIYSQSGAYLHWRGDCNGGLPLFSDCVNGPSLD